ncbi:MAG: hypothetical protein IKQ11_05605 [Paludibacteraceae bacterium]|nr:hypothetical protein [Paludibacteraceae bacterium]
MRILANILAKILSVVFYPLFIPTYGIALFCYVFHSPLLWAAIAIVGTVLFTCVLPMTSIWMLIRRGKVQDIQIEEATERTWPYLYSTIGFGFWSYLMSGILHAPQFITFVCYGATAALAIITLINRYWKISAHLTGVGGLIGGLMNYYVIINVTPAWHTVLAWCLFSLVMMFARLRLNAHTSEQVVAGWLLGIVCTCLPYSIMCYVA